tara:strand:+ start:43 stop:543 length:501 start_codon:yes stop_codon:yes gene_type:complete
MNTFWSRSKNHDLRYLSNFEPVLLTIPNEFFIPSMKDKTFPSVENAFQACKYAHSTNPVQMCELETCTPRVAKSYGSKTGMKKRGVRLDVNAWNKVSYKCMEELLKIRILCDERFRMIIQLSDKPFFHIETRPPYIWGGCMKNGVWVGHNRLGKIIDDLKNNLVII